MYERVPLDEAISLTPGVASSSSNLLLTCRSLIGRKISQGQLASRSFTPCWHPSTFFLKKLRTCLHPSCPDKASLYKMLGACVRRVSGLRCFSAAATDQAISGSMRVLIIGPPGSGYRSFAFAYTHAYLHKCKKNNKKQQQQQQRESTI